MDGERAMRGTSNCRDTTMTIPAKLWTVKSERLLQPHPAHVLLQLSMLRNHYTGFIMHQTIRGFFSLVNVGELRNIWHLSTHLSLAQRNSIPLTG